MGLYDKQVSNLNITQNEYLEMILQELNLHFQEFQPNGGWMGRLGNY
mgnify:CR=1 FL=1